MDSPMTFDANDQRFASAGYHPLNPYWRFPTSLMALFQVCQFSDVVNLDVVGGAIDNWLSDVGCNPQPLVNWETHHPPACDWLSIVGSGMKIGSTQNLTEPHPPAGVYG